MLTLASSQQGYQTQSQPGLSRPPPFQIPSLPIHRTSCLTCVPLLKPWPAIWLCVIFAMILRLLRFPPVQGDSDPRNVAIISFSWTVLSRKFCGFSELWLIQNIPMYLAASSGRTWKWFWHEMLSLCGPDVRKLQHPLSCMFWRSCFYN